jgi:hypothetical protein
VVVRYTAIRWIRRSIGFVSVNTILSHLSLIVMSTAMVATFVMLSLELGLAVSIFALAAAKWALAMIVFNA